MAEAVTMPTDTTPDPRDMERVPEAQRIPQAPAGRAGAPDVRERPALPETPARLPADDVPARGEAGT